MYYAYPATLVPEADGKFTVYFEGLPGATWGPSKTAALDEARNLLESAIEMLIEDGETLPSPPPANGRPIIEAEVGIL